MKTLRSDNTSAFFRIRKSIELHFSTPTPPEVNVRPPKEPTTISHSSETKWQNNGGMKNISSLENQIFHQNDLRGTSKREKFVSLTTQYLRSRREIDPILESTAECANFTYTIKYEDNYRVWNNFSMMYQSRIYRYNEYRVIDDGLQVCNSSDPRIKQIWRDLIAQEKEVLASKYCNVSVDAFHYSNYTLYRNFTVFFKPTEQSFTRQDYGVTFGYFSICSAKVSLSCNDYLVKVRYGDQYNVLQNFSVFTNNNMYDYREYQFGNEGLEMCASNDSRIRAVWRTRNSWEKFKDRYKCRAGSVIKIHARYYTVNKQFAIYLAPRRQYFTRNDYGVKDGRPYICEEKLRPISTDYTQEDLLMCNDSIINIKYDDGYKVRTDFSILYKNMVYDHTEYRVLSDGIKICNSTNNYVRNIWKVLNKWVKARMHEISCNKPIRFVWLYRKYYTVNKQFTAYFAASSQYFTRNDYGVEDGKLIICEENFRPESSEYTQEDLLMCNDSIINIKYDDEYQVRTDFLILYKNKVYDDTEYRVLNDGIKICNSTDNYVRNVWKVRNKWVKARMHEKSCNKPIRFAWFYRKYYTVNKQFTAYFAARSQYFTRNDYGVEDGKLIICEENFRPESSEYTQEDLLMCNDSIINIKYDDEYQVRTDFLILYKNKVYDYTEYRVLNDGIKICNSTDNYVRNVWKVRNKWIKARMHEKSCNKPIRFAWFYRKYYTVSKQFTVYFAAGSQYFTRNDYGVEDGKPYICEEQLRPTSTEYTEEDVLMCNDSIINIKYDDEYKVGTDFSILYKNKVYDDTEYRVLNDGIKICNSADNYVRNIWKVRNNWIKAKMHEKSCNKPIRFAWFYRKYYTVNKQFTVYFAAVSQYFTRNDYVVEDGKPYICEEQLRPTSTEYTEEDLLMCNDSIINIKYDDEYKVGTNFSILYKNKVYDDTEYRVLNDGIKICNSTDNYVRNIWKVRNKWVKARMHEKSCNKPIRFVWLYREYYTVNMQFTVYFAAGSQYFTRNDYGVKDGKPYICEEKLRPTSTEYTEEDLLMCNDSIINIKYDDEYKVRTDFSILYKNMVYDYTEYRVLNGGIKICNSTDNNVRNIWEVRNKWVKATMLDQSCNKAIRFVLLHRNYFTVSKQFTIYFAARSQYFKRNDYGLKEGKPYICKERLRPTSTEYTQEDLSMCNDSIININYDDEYKVRIDFSILYKKNLCDFTEYRVLNDSIKFCNSTDKDVRNIWKVRNKWVKGAMYEKSCNKSGFFFISGENYAVNEQLTVYLGVRGQYFTRNDYGVKDGKLIICKEKLRPESKEYTKEDLLMCNDSIINIKYDDEYKVRNDFSILYKKKVYDYTEYRVLNDSIKICNSTDNDVRQIWKVRNKWVEATMHYISCNKPIGTSWLIRKYYTVNKQFTVYSGGNGQYFTRNDYWVEDGKFIICKENYRPKSSEYTQEDLLMCKDSIINIKYDEEYKVRTDFSILYKNKVYDYTEYRVLNDGIKICNSADDYVGNIWKVRNKWVKAAMHEKRCTKSTYLYFEYYTVNMQFTLYSAGNGQYLTRNDYGVEDGKPKICEEKFKPISTEYTQEDLLMCNDSIINIKYDDEYKVRTDFSILYKNMVYDYTEYRVLNDGIKICNFDDNCLGNIWKLRNKWIKGTMHVKSCTKSKFALFFREYYVVNEQLTVYLGRSGRYFTRNFYGVKDGKLYICEEKLRPTSTEYTQEDVLMCNDSIINIKYDDEYKVNTDFSILYKNNLYDYTEYRVLNDCIKICNSTDNYVRNIWKLRNDWIKATMHEKSCNKPITYIDFDRWEYTVLKNFGVLISAAKKLITRYDYALFEGKLITCVTECAKFTFTIKYEDEYRVWNNFSIMYDGRMYYYDEYRITDDGLQVCNSSDSLIKEKWRNFIVSEKITLAFKYCNASVDGFYSENYTLHTNFTVFFKHTNQNFRRQDYGVILGYFAICSGKIRLSCNDDLVKVKYGEQYNVFKNFSLVYNNKIYDYREYRFSHDSVEMCDSNDSRVQAIWRTRNSWQRSLPASCYRSYKLNARYYTVTKQFAVYSADNGQYFKRNDYAVIDGKPYVCGKENLRPIYVITNFKIIIAPLCALALSIISLLLLLIVYCMLSELRTLPGLNLMSLSFALLLWQTYLVVFLSLYSHVGKLFEIPCARLFVANKFMTYSIIMNAVVNIYHLRKTFCGNTLVKSDELKKWNRFLKYSFFSWGVPVLITIVYIILVNEDVIRFNQPIASVKNDVQSSLRFYQRIVFANGSNGDATANEIRTYQRLVSLKNDVQSRFNQSTVFGKEDATEDDARIYQPIVSLKKDSQPELRFDQSTVEHGRRIYQPIASLKKDVQSSLKFYQRIIFANGDGKEDDARIYRQISGDCINGRITPDWSAAVDVYGLQGCLLLYIIGMFIFTAYRIRQKLNASRNIKQKSNIVKRRKFVILLKLSTTTALSYWFPLFISRIVDFDFDIKIALYTITLLTGAYIGIAFVFTQRNYQLLKKKYFPANNKPPVNEIPLNRL